MKITYLCQTSSFCYKILRVSDRNYERKFNFITLGYLLMYLQNWHSLLYFQNKLWGQFHCCQQNAFLISFQNWLRGEVCYFQHEAFLTVFSKKALGTISVLSTKCSLNVFSKLAKERSLLFSACGILNCIFKIGSGDNFVVKVSR